MTIHRYLLALSLLFSICASAQQIITENGKAYRLHTVAKGEGFYRLSVNYGVSQEEIIIANPDLRKTGLVEGVTIRIPMKSQEAIQEANDENRPTKIHVVTAGQTAFSISRLYDMTLPQLIQLNPDVASGVREGQQLRVFSSDNEKPQQPSTSPVPQPTNATVGYVIKKGDTLYSVAKAHGLTIPQFMKLNPNVGAVLKEGDIVNVPLNSAITTYVLHTIEPGETLYSIGRRYGVKPQQISEANLSLNASSLPVGSVIRIPSSQIPDEDDSFVYHRMQPGETLFSLTIRYDILQDKIQAVNPGVDWNKLSIGQIIAVPKKVALSHVIYKEHTVGRRETLFSIAAHYDISVDDLRAANDNISPSDLKKGMLLRIPQVVENEISAPATTDTSFIGNRSDNPFSAINADYDYVRDGKPTINVFLMLPFDATTELSRLRASGVNIDNRSFDFKPRRYVEFFEGVRLALDSLASAGANISLKVYDTNSRLDAVNQLTAASSTPDLIIGPAHLTEMPDVFRYSETHHVPLVLPFAQADSNLIHNPFIFQASYIDTISTCAMDAQILEDCRIAGDKMIIISPNTKSSSDKKRVEFFKSKCAELGIEYVEHDYNTSKTDAFISALSIEKKNCIVLPTTDEARVNSVIVSMAGCLEAHPELRTRLLATSNYLAFNTIEYDVFHKLSTQIFSTYAVDYDDPKANYIIEKYRELYETEPVAIRPYFQRLKSMSGFSEYGLWGYDIAMFFVNARLSLGKNFYRRINEVKSTQLQSNFFFRSLTNWGGWVNVGLKKISFNVDGTVRVANINVIQ